MRKAGLDRAAAKKERRLEENSVGTRRVVATMLVAEQLPRVEQVLQAERFGLVRRWQNGVVPDEVRLDSSTARLLQAAPVVEAEGEEEGEDEVESLRCSWFLVDFLLHLGVVLQLARDRRH